MVLVRAALPALALFSFVAFSACATSLFGAAYVGDAVEVRRLMAEGANPDQADSRGWTPLMIAAAEGHSEVVRVLLEEDADPNARNASGRTALMFASRYGFDPIVSALIESGADVDLTEGEYGETALMAAARKGHEGVVRLLLARGADPTAKDRSGNTALELGRKSGDRETVELLEAAARQ